MPWVVVPALDEADNLRVLVPRIAAEVATFDPLGRVLVVDDGSTDDTGNVVAELMTEHPAGVGAREVTLIALLAPVTGATTATALALLTRALHTGGDLLLAFASWALVRATRPGVPLPGPNVGGRWERS